MTYPGGKAGAGVYQTIINQIPPHDTYIEAFAGGGAVARKLRPAPSTILIDKSATALNALSDLASPKVTLLQTDALRYLATRQWTGREFLYLDPPYPMFTRRCQRDLYDFELTDIEHCELLAMIDRIPCPIAISSYWSKLYADALKGWRCIAFTSPTRRGPATEWLWMNYPEPAALHDYRYLGDDFRERERIARKTRRWLNRLSRLPAVERRALLSAMTAGTVRDPIAVSGDAAGSRSELASPEVAIEPGKAAA